MNYILREDFLPLSPRKQSNMQYYKWMEKKRVEKEKAEEEVLLKKLSQIEQQQRERQQTKSRVRKPSKMSRKYYQDTSSKQEQIYEKNMMWKQLVDDKVQKLRTEMKQQQQKQQLKHQQAHSRICEKKMYREPEHKGPIKAWNQRFENYLRNKDGQIHNASESMFHPTINSKSKFITNNMVGKVQNRLLEYGQKLKEKKAELEQAFNQELFAKKPKQSTTSIDSCRSDIFFRLYKDGQRLNRRKNQYESEYTFVPEINRNSNILASKVAERRKPLYQSKINQEKNVIESDKSKKVNKQMKEKSFNDFMKRNEALLDKIEQNKNRKTEEEKQKQNKLSKQCTFVPALNPHSLKIAANRVLEASQTNIEKISSSSADKNGSRSLIFKKTRNAETSIFDNRSSIFKMGKQYCEDLSNPQLNISCEQKNVLFSQLDFHPNQSNSLTENSLSFDKKTNQKKNSNILREVDSQIPTDRYSQHKVIINEQYEEDSIEKAKDLQWANELDFMESQIEEMMKRVSN